MNTDEAAQNRGNSENLASVHEMVSSCVANWCNRPELGRLSGCGRGCVGDAESEKNGVQSSRSSRICARPSRRQWGYPRSGRPWVGLAGEAHKPNCLDHGRVARTGVRGGLRSGAHPDSERAGRLQHGGRAAVLQCGIEERQIRPLLSRSPKTNLCELLVSSPGLHPLLVPPQAYAPTHRYVSAGHCLDYCRPRRAPAGPPAPLFTSSLGDPYALFMPSLIEFTRVGASPTHLIPLRAGEMLDHYRIDCAVATSRTFAVEGVGEQ